MQRIVVILLFIISQLGTRAQPYQSVFGKTSTDWSVYSDNLSLKMSQYYYVAYDTSFNGHTYKKIATEYVDAKDIYLREDTLTGLVWLIDLGNDCIFPDISEKMVCNMSLAVGDSFSLQGADLARLANNDTNIFVDSVFFVLGEKRIRFKTPIWLAITEPITFYEGVGPNYSLFWITNGCANNVNDYLLCGFKDSVKTDYTNLRYNGDCAPNFAGITDVRLKYIDIMPNPARQMLGITCIIDAKTNCVITNMMGQILDRHELNSGYNQISINTLANGLYHLNFYLEGNLLGAKNFVKIE